jgi:hypothetical protein
MVMSIDLKQGLDAHPKIARCLERIDPSLHEPGRGGVANNVRTVLPAAYRCPRTPQLVDWRAHIVHDMRNPVLAIKPVPAPQVGK